MAEFSITEARAKIEKQIGKERDKKQEVYSQTIKLFEESGLSYGSIVQIVKRLQAELLGIAECATKSTGFATLWEFARKK